MAICRQFILRSDGRVVKSTSATKIIRKNYFIPLRLFFLLGAREIKDKLCEQLPLKFSLNELEQLNVVQLTIKALSFRPLKICDRTSRNGATPARTCARGPWFEARTAPERRSAAARRRRLQGSWPPGPRFRRRPPLPEIEVRSISRLKKGLGLRPLNQRSLRTIRWT